MAMETPPSPLPLQQMAKDRVVTEPADESVLEVRPTYSTRPTPETPNAPDAAKTPTSSDDGSDARPSGSISTAPSPTEPQTAVGASTPAEVPLQTPAMAQVAHLRRRLEPHLTVLHEDVDWQHAEDPIEALRRLRVATRRLRAFTRVFAPMLGAKRARRLHKQLRRVTRGVGPLREWDVLLDGLLAEHAEADPLLRAALEYVIVDGRTQRAKAASQAEDAVARVDVRAVAERLDRDLDLVCGRLSRLDDRLPAEIWTLIEPTLERTFDRLPHPEHEHEVETLHEVRVRAKRLRYALELLRPTLGTAYRPLRKPAKRIQRLIGEHHDRALLASVLGRHRALLDGQGLTTLAEALRPLEERLLAQRKDAHASAIPVLGLLERQRYHQLAAQALGIALDPEPGSTTTVEANDDEQGEPLRSEASSAGQA